MMKNIQKQNQNINGEIKNIYVMMTNMLNYLDIDSHVRYRLFPDFQIDETDELDNEYYLNFVVYRDMRDVRDEVYTLFHQYRYSDEYPSRGYENKTLAAVIVTEVLDKYDIKYNLFSLLKEFEISIGEFEKLSYRLRQWADKNYWENSVEYIRCKYVDNLEIKKDLEVN